MHVGIAHQGGDLARRIRSQDEEWTGRLKGTDLVSDSDVGRSTSDSVAPSPEKGPRLALSDGLRKPYNHFSWPLSDVLPAVSQIVPPAFDTMIALAESFWRGRTSGGQLLGRRPHRQSASASARRERRLPCRMLCGRETSRSAPIP